MEENFDIVIRIVLLISIVECISMSCMKKSSGNNNKPLLYCGMVGYATVAYMLWRGFHYDGMGHVNLIWNCMSTIFGLTVGYLLFNEELNRYSCLSVVFAVTAIYLCHLSSEVNKV